MGRVAELDAQWIGGQGLSVRDAGRALSARHNRRDVHVARSEPQARQRPRRASCASQRTFDRGNAQVALFQDDVHDAIISQFLPLVANSPTLFSYVSNVDHVRARGIEGVVNVNDVLVRGLELSANATYVDARTLALSGRASATAPAGSAVGKFLPNIPKWRTTFVGTYHASPATSIALSGRYASKMFTTLDDADVNPNTYQGFTEWFVMDARATHRVDAHWFASIGVDNLLDRKYFLFHPFPQRTLVASLKYTL